MGDYPPQGTGAIPGDPMSLTPAERLIVQALIINDLTPFAGADIATILAGLVIVDATVDAILADTATIAWGDITGIINDIGVFPTANYATLAAYVENIRTRLTTLQTDLTEGKLRSFRRTYAFASTNEQVANAAEVSLAAPAVVTVTFPAGATLLEAKVAAVLKANNQTAAKHNIGITLQKNVAAGGWVDIRDFTANPPLTLPEVDATGDSITLVEVLTPLTTGQSVQFRFQVDSDNAGAVNYTQTFVLIVEYDFQ